MSGELDEEEKTRVILRRLHIFSRPYVLRLSWCQDPADARTICHHASCFAVKIGDDLFGVTAAHVITQFLTDQDRLGDLRLMLDEEDISLSIIEHGERIDITTFKIDQGLLDRTTKRCLAYRVADWPPAPPLAGGGIVLTGYPAERQTVIRARHIDTEQVSNCLIIDDIHLQNMTIRVRARHLRSVDGEIIPPFTEDVGGYSGAPILTVSSEPHQLFRLGGVLYEGAGRQDDDGEFLEFKAEPIARIRPDGRLNHNLIAL